MVDMCCYREKDFAEFPRRPDPTLPAFRRGIMRSGFALARPICATSADFQYSGLLTEANHLGTWPIASAGASNGTADNLRVTNVPEAGAIIRLGVCARGGSCKSKAAHGES